MKRINRNIGDRPHSPEAEQAVLGAMLMNPDSVIPDAKEYLTNAFYGPVHRQIFDAIVWMHGKGRPVDLVTLTQHMADIGDLEKVGGAGYISSLSDPGSGQLYEYYKRVLLDKQRSRDILDAADNIAKMVHSNQADLGDAEKDIAVQLSAIKTAFEGRDTTKSWDEEVDEWATDWDLMASGKKESAMETRWSSWNNEVGGIDPGYTIISGRSSSGKSCLLGNILLDAAMLKNRPALFISYEMPVRMVLSRMIADVAGVDGMHLFRPDKVPVGPGQKRAIAVALDKIRKSPLRIIHNPNLSADAACHIARKMFLERGDIVIGVDYLQIAPKPSGIERGANREREISTISATFRNLSKEIDRPVITLSQLNQDGSTRESTAIQMDADNHFKVDREKDNKTGKVTEKGVWIYKSRNGRSDYHLPLFLDGPKFRFVER